MSELMSQRSPKLVQPMPRMTALSRMPCAMGLLLCCKLRARQRRSLPEIAAELALPVDGLDAEPHPQGGADLLRPALDIAMLHHHAGAVLELDKAEMERRVGS